MGYSNSLCRCILAMPELYKQWNQKVLTIIVVPKAKYYTVLTDGELEMRSPEEMGEGAGITFRGTLNELRSILSVKLEQGDLFAKYPAETTPPEVAEQLSEENYAASPSGDEADPPDGEQLRTDNTVDDSAKVVESGGDSS